jgi:UDP-glucose 4-epimerase
MKRVLLTGVTGFVGANLCRRLLNDGHEVHCLVRDGFSNWRIEDIQRDIYLHVTDLTNSESLLPIVSSSRPDWVFHLAAHGAYSWQTDLKKIVQTNILSTINLVEACLQTGFEIFINTGSSSEYGYKDHAPLENEWIDPNSYYAVTKASATLFCRHAAILNNVCIPTLRLYSIYGAYENPGRLIPTIILHGLKGSLPPLVDANIARDYLYVKDVENAYILLANRLRETTGEVYNLGSGIQTTLSEVVSVTRNIFDLSVEPQWGTMPNRQWDTIIWKANIDNIKAIGWNPEFTFEQGFRQTVDWFRENPQFMKYYSLYP